MRHRAAARDALRQYAGDLRKLDTARFVDVPPELAWNTVLRRLRTEHRIETADFESRIIQTHWQYAATRQNGDLAVQTRRRFRAVLSGADAASYRVNVSAAVERRERATCADAGPWVTTGEDAGSPALKDVFDNELRALGRVPFDDLVFPGTPSELAPMLSDLTIRRWRLVPMSGAPGSRAAGGQAEESFQREELTVDVFLSLEVAAVPVDDSSVRVVADVELRTRARTEQEATEWMRAKVAPIREDFYARLVERLRPKTVARRGEVAEAGSDPEPDEPLLAAPPDPLFGVYELTVAGVIAPRKTPSGLDWDPGTITQELFTKAHLVAKVVGGLLPVTRSLTSAVEMVPQEYLDLAAGLVGQYTAPDMQVLLSVPRSGVVATPVVRDSYVAAWEGAISVLVDGDASLRFEVWDIDMYRPDFIGRGAFSLSELANACGRVCRRGPTGLVTCLQLRSVRGSATSQ